MVWMNPITAPSFVSPELMATWEAQSIRNRGGREGHPQNERETGTTDTDRPRQVADGGRCGRRTGHHLLRLWRAARSQPATGETAANGAEPGVRASAPTVAWAPSPS